MNTAPIEIVLSRLDKVRQRQPGQWSARCAAHDDKGPSLSVRETADGAVLLHCFGGCKVSEVVAALGIDMADLFPPTEKPRNAPRKIARTLTASQALELLEREATVIAVAGANIAHGKPLSVVDRARLMQAAGRVSVIAREVAHA